MCMKSACVILVVLFSIGSACFAEDDNRGYLESPPVFIVSEPDVPLTGLGAEMPAPGQIVPDVDLTALESDVFKQNGATVQPALNVKFDVLRIGALRGFNGGWAAGLTIPWQQTRVRGGIGGLPASGTRTGLGELGMVAKKTFWENDCGDRVVFAGGIELPTGKSNATFDQSNAVTNAYYRNYPRRMPLSWQPGSGTVNGYLGLSYLNKGGRFSYEFLVGTKLHSKGDESVKIGNIFIAAGTGTYGISRNLAASLGLTLRSQADDSYPNAPSPGVGQLALVGTTTHGTSLYLDPSIRFNIMGRVTVGVGVHYPIVKPDNGLVPRTRLSIIFFPSL